ncbi:carboxy terminal-processing peptidase [uncultured Succinivibrio sp.]|uniref:carboxy terminal-processing peptidase n=1 Tax=uncultured Succinivibrio sp. TaxID=540749 RepID=UPI0025D86103|nr:carboxy terminal-processing peptidase [uncultured Succinivibrio sp.]
MNKLAKIALACMFAGGLGVCEAKLTIPAADQMPVLLPEPRHDTACSRIYNFFTRAHYKIVNVDDKFATNVIDRLMSYLDYTHSLYTQGEVDLIYANTKGIINSLDKCYLNYPYDLYNKNIKKRYEKYSYLIGLLDSPLDLKKDDSIELDRTKAPYAATEEELKNLWLKELKNEYEIQLLNGKTPKEATKRIRNRYIASMRRLSQITSEDVFSVFENAFATAIDPHTNYFGPVESENFNDDMNLSLEGIGAVLSQEDEYTVIESILPGSPAEKSKQLKPKDKIIGVKQKNGKFEDIIGWRLTEVVKQIKGKKGTKVTLEIERGEGAATKTFNVDIVRDKIRLQDKEAKSKVYNSYNGKKVGVITISSFYTDLHLNVKREIDKLKAQNVDSIIIDLRNNGGGLLPEAVYTTGQFIKSGPVVLVRDVNSNEVPYEDDDQNIDYDGPLVVLINRLSASSSEIMAAALQDYGRALIVGDTSYGKGTVQQSRPLTRLYDLSGSDLGSIHYTIAKFYRINGGSTQLRGVTPDIVLPTMIDVTELGEKNEPNALKWDKISKADYTRYSDPDRFVDRLTEQYKSRIEKDPVFNVIKSERERYFKLKEGKVITVNFDKRKKLFDEDEKTALKNTNIRLKAMGKDPVKSVKDLPTDFEYDDPILLETVNIASDYADMITKKSDVHSIVARKDAE